LRKVIELACNTTQGREDDTSLLAVAKVEQVELVMNHIVSKIFEDQHKWVNMREAEKKKKEEEKANTSVKPFQLDKMDTCTKNSRRRRRRRNSLTAIAWTIGVRCACPPLLGPAGLWVVVSSQLPCALRFCSPSRSAT